MFENFQLSKSAFNVPLSQVVKSQCINSGRSKQQAGIENPTFSYHKIPAAPSVSTRGQKNSTGAVIGSQRLTPFPVLHPVNSGNQDIKTSERDKPPRKSYQNVFSIEPSQDKTRGHLDQNSYTKSAPFDMPVSQIVKPLFRKSDPVSSHKDESTLQNIIDVPPAPEKIRRGTKHSFQSQLPMTQKFQDDPFKKSENPNVRGVQLRSVEEIPRAYRSFFSFPFFNILQSLVFDEVLYTDKSIVASAPTGSGKTVIFELALIRLLMKTENMGHRGKIIYMAPMKALCSERYHEWKSKLGCHGLTCLEVTGDSELDDIGELMTTNLICTTPEKWDSMSRRWKDNKTLFQQIQLFLIDEIHILNDSNRGATVEAVVSRMRTLQTARFNEDGNSMRFVAVSATMPNYNDIAEWLGTPHKPATSFNLGEQYRPVKLDRVVLGYPFKEGTSDFRFDMNLSYRLRAIIDSHSHGKPTLVFCSSRKSVVQSAETLARDMRSHSILRNYSAEILQRAAGSVHENKLSDLLQMGIGIHHAGLDSTDRQTVEDLFKSAQLPVLISTSTLAMGVNLPAHLVIIKSTHYYNMGMVQEYSDMQILQMIGRAGRPQFDTSATAVIMTKMSWKAKYESLVNGTQLIESSLHKNLIEHLNAEIVLQTIREMTMVVEWIRHTFLYVRVMKNPKHYGLPPNLSTADVEKRLKDMCLQDVQHLSSHNLVSVDEDTSSIMPTGTGRLMARYCITFETMKQFHSIKDNQGNIADMLMAVSQCSEFEDIQLRTNEKRILNTLNKDKNKETIRFPMVGKVKTKQMKVNCLIQAQLSCLPVQDFSLSQDMSKIFRVGQRVAKCLMEFIFQGTNYTILLHSILIYKAFKTKLWFDSRYVARQLDGIGPTMSLALANSGLSSFQKLEQANPRDIELIVNRHAPFGNQIRESVAALPKYELAVEQMKCYKSNKAVLVLSVDLLNRLSLETRPSSYNNHQSILIVGDAADSLIFKWRVMDAAIIREGALTRNIEVKRCSQGTKLSISLLSQDWVGLDIQVEYEPIYSEGWFEPVKTPSEPKGQTLASKLRAAFEKAKYLDLGNSFSFSATSSASSSVSAVASTNRTSGECNHKCLDKSKCGHKCCKSANSSKRISSLALDTGNAKQSRLEESVIRENKDMKEMYGILGQHRLVNNQPRLSMKRGWNFPLSDRNPSIAMTDTANAHTSQWNQEEQNTDHNDFEDDWGDKSFLHCDALNNGAGCSNTGNPPCSIKPFSSHKVSDSPSSDVQTLKDFNSDDDDDIIFIDDVWEYDELAGSNFGVMMEGDEKSTAKRSTVTTNEERYLPQNQLLHISKARQAQVEADPDQDVNEQMDHFDLDVTSNGWADLDAFQKRRQSLFKNGRPQHLQDDYISDDELPSLTNSPEVNINDAPPNIVNDNTGSCRWVTNTSSDEELCQIVDATVSPGDHGRPWSQKFVPEAAMHSEERNILYDVSNYAKNDGVYIHNKCMFTNQGAENSSHNTYFQREPVIERKRAHKAHLHPREPQPKSQWTPYQVAESPDQQLNNSPSVIFINDSDDTALERYHYTTLESYTDSALERFTDTALERYTEASAEKSASPTLYVGKISQSVTPIVRMVGSHSATGSDKGAYSKLHSTVSVEDDEVSSREGLPVSQASHRYGHVKAWKKDSSNQRKAPPSSEGAGNPKSMMSKLFVPKGKISTEETTTTTSLFEGIF